MTDTRKKILETIDANRDKAIKFLQDIVAIPSVTGDEGKIQAFLVRLSEEGRPRRRHVGVRLGSAEEASRLHSGRSRATRAAPTSSPPGKARAAAARCC